MAMGSRSNGKGRIRQPKSGIRREPAGVFAMLLGAGLLLSACAGPGDTAPADSSAVQDASGVKLRVVTMFGGTDSNAPVYERITKEFLDAHPEVSLEDDSGTSDEQWKASVAAAFSAGDEPDVLQFFTDATADQLVAMDKFVSIDQIRSAYPDYAADIYPWALQQVANSDGVERAVPTTGYWEGLYCNKELFEKYHIELPRDWASFEAAVKAFRQNGILPVACSLGNVPHYWMEYLLLYTEGADAYQQNWTKATPEQVQALSLFQTLRDMGAFPENTDTISNDYAQELFRTKQAAMILEGNWYLSAITDVQHTTVIPFPGVPQQNAADRTVVGGMTSGFYITKRAWKDPARQKAAVAFVRAHTSQAAVQKYWEYGGGITTAATRVTEQGSRSPLATAARNYMQGASQIVLSTDSRMAPRAYRELIAGITKVSSGASAAELAENVAGLNAENSPDLSSAGSSTVQPAAGESTEQSETSQK